MGKDEGRQNGGEKMNLTEAKNLPYEKFVELCEECRMFNDEYYKNHKRGEISAVIKRGSERIKYYLCLKNKLI